MEQQKGFSLIEVLISLVLVTTLGLSLLSQQGQTNQLLTHALLRADASQFLDQIDESLISGIDQFPTAPTPYSFVLQKNKQNATLSLSWFKDSGSLIRKHSFIKTFQ